MKEDKPVHFSLDCKSGRHSGIARPIANGDGFVVPAAGVLLREPQHRYTGRGPAVW